MDLRWDVVGWAAVALLLFAAEAMAPGAFTLWMGLAAAAVFVGVLVVLVVPGIPLLAQAADTGSRTASCAPAVAVQPRAGSTLRQTA